MKLIILAAASDLSSTQYDVAAFLWRPPVAFSETDESPKEESWKKKKKEWMAINNFTFDLLRLALNGLS